ncbi:MAG TPA: radical SAM protein [Desulfobacterales bacterium]
MHYEGPIYRPPSEADSLLVQATVGCPWNRCTFCMVYKKGPVFRERSTAEIGNDLIEARRLYGDRVRTLFLPAGNTIAMRTERLAAVCMHARRVFPRLERITVYGSSQYIYRKGIADLKRLADAGLTRIHVGLESGDDAVLRRIRKGTDSARQTEAGRQVIEAGLELSLYVILGIGGTAHTDQHARATAAVINAIRPHFIRLRTFVPKIGTPLLQDVERGRFEMLGPHGVLRETRRIVEALDTPGELVSDHYTNYINLAGRLPQDRHRLLATIDAALRREEACFRPFFVGTQ